MTPQLVSALKGVALAVLAALLAAGVIDPGQSDTLTGIVTAAVTFLAAVAVKRPRDHE